MPVDIDADDEVEFEDGSVGKIVSTTRNTITVNVGGTRNTITVNVGGTRKVVDAEFEGEIGGD